MPERMKILNDGESKLVPISKLSSHPRNPRQGDIGAIHQSIEDTGWYGVIVAQKSTGHVLAGNHRLIAAREHGAKKLPVIWLDVDDQTALKILLSDNRLNDLASYDFPSLAEILKELALESDLVGTGYDGDDLDEIIAGLQPFNPVGDPRAATGQVTAEDVAKAKAGMAHTSQTTQAIAVACPECGHDFEVIP